MQHCFMIIHSTGHRDRLGRITEPASFGSHSYSKEELIAEMGASFLLGRAGIFNPPQLEQAAAYIQGWIRKLKEDNSMVIRAAGQAQTATNFILNKEPGEERS
jgi:antirestriction protein ArdC